MRNFVVVTFILKAEFYPIIGLRNYGIVVVLAGLRLLCFQLQSMETGFFLGFVKEVDVVDVPL
jgi:hypothetical protein